LRGLLYDATDDEVGKVKQTGESQKTCHKKTKVRPYRDMRRGKRTKNKNKKK